tara:strand:- start:2012 stop:3937 length:1926 start_codon:yes stop_codon:yes gene_type:complete
MTSIVAISQDDNQECNICCEKYTNHKRKKIQCGACDFECCRNCIEIYLLDQLQPSCMSCKKNWTDTFCAENLTSFMRGKWKKHQKAMLFEVEKARFPETMPAVANVLKVKEWKKVNAEEHNKIYELERKIRELKRSREIRERNIQRAMNGESIEKEEEEQNKYQRACPNNDCNGFLSSQWKCGVCNVWVCKDCFEIKGDSKDAEHTCDPNTLLTAQALKKETKPCPNCHCSIYKISGCDQMWCTQCHIAFSWRTGKKVRGHVHNPHYYQWINAGGQPAAMPGAAMPCGGLPAYTELKRAFYRINILSGITEPSHDELGVIRKLSDMLFQNDVYTKQLFYKMNLRLISRTERTKDTCKHYYDAKKKQLVSKRIRSNGELHVSAFALSNIEQWDGMKFKHADEIKQIEASEIHGSWEMTRHLRNFRERMDLGCWDYMVIPSELKFIRDVIQGFANRHSGIQHFEHVELDDWRRKVNANQDNKKLRIDYILKEITESEMKTKLLKKERQMKKATAVHDVYELYTRICSESFRKITGEKDLTYKILCEEWEKQEKIRVYCNEELYKFQKNFNLSVPYIKIDGRTENWRGAYAYTIQPISEHWELFKDRNLEVKIGKNVLYSAVKWYEVTVGQVREGRYGYRRMGF